ncbi:MAG: vitamin B12-dependent ribonucleotide reductase [Acidobacteria bacterium]|nr:vitamin B12-dependent ribonucleotide reductase [Acidobacteriota bacterium]MCZ6878658.1 vitamin B12-dependent ribonucleotide reductase [Acidobacteriota bacterium]
MKKAVGKAEVSTGLTIEPYFSQTGRHPFDDVKWETRTAEIKDFETGKVAFRQENLEFPQFWSQRATDIVASKYFRGHLGSSKREHSVKQLIGRIVDTLTVWGKKMHYFASSKDAQTFNYELSYLLLHQMAAFNSPVQFNMGIKRNPQCSACFINSVQDNMGSIMKLAKTEALIFKGGSGSGVNLSNIRSSVEPLAVGGFASGPISFMRGYDSFAGAIKSGGATRRAAKMVILNADHPDIKEYIWSKAREEEKAHKLIQFGYDDSIDGEAYRSVQFQNANNSVSVTNEFMEAVVNEKEWKTRKVTTGEVVDTYKAREVMQWIAEAAWICGDPGLQFYTTLNDWHTCPNSGPINACNPCSEYVFLDNSACNLSSLNLMKFVKEEGRFDIQAFRRAVQTMILAQEIIVDNSSYPTPEITRVSHEFRTLGLGYANLGALLMAGGLPYDSDQARSLSSAITAVMTGQAYLTSAEIAEQMGAFAGFEKNRITTMRVMHKHREALSGIDSALVPMDLLHSAMEVWDQAIVKGSEHGYRNAQVTLLAPTGTIAFMMDCDTTGVEPEFSLVKVKKLVGGGTLKIVNNTIPRAVKRLGYSQEEIDDILGYIKKKETIEGAPHLKEEHLAVFDCADRPARGSRSIQYLGHIKMCGAVQPFLSGAISKTINLPNEAPVEEIMEAYIQGWKYGMKSVSIYRDGCKMVQPLSNKDGLQPVSVRQQRNMPKDHPALQHEFRIKGFKGYLTMGMYPEDEQLGEIFLNFAKQGSTLQGMTMAWAIAISMGLQRGVPLEDYVRMFAHMSFEPSGLTDNSQIPFTTSIPDYVVRYLATRFLSSEVQEALGIHNVKPNGSIQGGVQVTFSDQVALPEATRAAQRLIQDSSRESHTCLTCGNLMQRNGNCYICSVCGSTSGCS